jgi:hypothetical protein
VGLLRLLQLLRLLRLLQLLLPRKRLLPVRWDVAAAAADAVAVVATLRRLDCCSPLHLMQSVASVAVRCICCSPLRLL